MKEKDKDKLKEKPVEETTENTLEETKTPSTVDEKLEGIQRELEGVKDKYLRALAEMENFKKRNSEELKRERKYAAQPIADKLIDQLEVFEQALNIQTEDANFKNFLYGFKMIKDMLFNVLVDEGVKKINLVPGDAFDPNTMEPIEAIYDPNQPENTIIKVVKNGYMFKDRLLRPVTVVINQKPETEEQSETKNENLDGNVA
ncbi:MAG: nucleotide exchange factor GrpE [Tenericutes bacterium HGW-Tenericutes-1]|jgi:molecular chaperone GrpE|nr:MAG: nucleotide exchange factor GrpE [Tenericutes bacterium HGW-Tenericutes-1]